MLASAILDRLVHHSTIVNILGNSYRTATALSKIADKNNWTIVHKNIGTIVQNNGSSVFIRIYNIINISIY